MMLRRSAGILFLLTQVALVTYAHLGRSRWLCWAPNDYAVEYQLRVKARGHDLTPAEIQARYQVAEHGWYENPPENIMDVVRQFEQASGNRDTAQVRLTYRLDGGETREWQWPEER